MLEKIEDIGKLKTISKEIRQDVVRILAAAGSGHLGGSLGLADVFACLYLNILNHDPANPDWIDRDRLILSIGHVAPVFYTSLAYAGYFPKEELMSLRKLGSRLQGHPGKEYKLPGIELSAGSLGQGLSVAVGLALAGKMDNKSWRVFSIHGDGELQEGSIWEAAMSAGHYHLDNLISLVDRNHMQIDGYTKDVMDIEPLKDKWEAFGWYVIKCNGHDHRAIINAYQEAARIKNRPTVIIAETTMGKGVKSIEGNYKWHGKAPTAEEMEIFLKELE